MNDPIQPPSAAESNHAIERTKQVTVLGWTAGVTAVILGGTLVNVPSWPGAVGVAAISAMVATIAYFTLKKN